jgi:hypothetical protein
MSIFQVPIKDSITQEEKELLVAEITNSVVAAFVALQQESNTTEEPVVEETVEEPVVEETTPTTEEPTVEE